MDYYAMMETEDTIINETINSASDSKETSPRTCYVEIKKEPCSTPVCEDDEVELEEAEAEEDKIKAKNFHCKEESYNNHLNADYKEAHIDMNSKYLSVTNFSVKREPIVILNRIPEYQYSNYHIKHEKRLLKTLLQKVKKEAIENYTEDCSASLLNSNEPYQQGNEDILSRVSGTVSVMNTDSKSDGSDMKVKCETVKLLKNQIFGSNESKGQKYYCNFCEKSFHCKKSLVWHLPIHETNNMSKCKYCGKYLAERMLHRHLLYHRKICKCLVCEKSFAFKSQLVTHMTSHSTEKTVNCKVCGKWCVSEKQLYDHKISHVRKSFECSVCNKNLSSKGHLSEHMSIHSDEKKFKCDFCSKYFKTKGGLNSHSFTHKDVNVWECETCRKRFTLKSNLLRHVKSHSGEKLYKCDMCGKCFTAKSTIKGHKDLVHNSECIRFSCDLCGANYKKKYILLRHIKVHHIAGKRYECEICKMKFFKKCLLTSHMLYHIRDRNYNCSLCNKSYIYKPNLSEHVRRVHQSKKKGKLLSVLKII